MLDWLDADLSATTARWKIVFFHHVPYPMLHHLDDPLCTAARERLVPIVERYGVQLVLTGHEHNYQRLKPSRGSTTAASGPATTYITSGGGGAELHPVVSRPDVARADKIYQYLRVEVSPTALIVHALNIDGKEYDKVTLAMPALQAKDPVVNAASSAPGVAPASLITIFGDGLATDTTQGSQRLLPVALAGTTVSLNDVQLPLLYVSPSQINAQLPLDVTGTATLRVTTASGSSAVPLQISDTAPGIFSWGVQHANGVQVSATNPARPGETLSLFMTGLGRVEGALPVGVAPPASPQYRVFTPVQAQFTDVLVSPSFAGLAKDEVGVYVVQVDVPAGLASRTYTLRVLSGGVASNAVELPVQR
jgi:uncharacterized protein (TIGR03437 family)